MAYRPVAVPTDRERHVMNRLGQGYTPALLAQLRAAGGETAWFEQQLDWRSVPESAAAQQVDGWFPRLTDRTPAQKKATDEAETCSAYQYALDLANYSLQRRIYSARTLHETMVDLWSTHLHVNARDFPGFVQRWGYDQTIREHALGTFEDLLLAATLHPAMLLFLDNFLSVRGRPNENHGRELLELHTVGRAAGYDEQMVKDSARILSGWTVDERTWQAYYDTGRHTTGAVRVLGFSHANSSADGRALVESYLRYLARHEATARTVCRKIAMRFVADEPPAALVDRLVTVYRDSGTDIPSVLRALVASPEFWASAGQKVRTPVDDVIATVRVLGVQAQQPTGSASYVNELSASVKSIKLFQWPRPDGPPDTADAWCSPTRMLSSWKSHWALAGGYWPNGQVTYRTGRAWLPTRRLTYADLVDHLCRVLLGKPADARLLRLAVKATGTTASTVITADHKLVRYQMNRVLACLLDTPDHMTR